MKLTLNRSTQSCVGIALHHVFIITTLLLLSVTKNNNTNAFSSTTNYIHTNGAKSFSSSHSLSLLSSSQPFKFQEVPQSSYTKKKGTTLQMFRSRKRNH